MTIILNQRSHFSHNDHLEAQRFVELHSLYAHKSSLCTITEVYSTVIYEGKPHPCAIYVCRCGAQLTLRGDEDADE